MTSRWGHIANEERERKRKKRKLKQQEEEEQQQQQQQQEQGQVYDDLIPILNLSQLANPIRKCTDISNEYERLNHIEEGSYGVVTRAKEISAPNRMVAVKKLKQLNGGGGIGFPITSLREIDTLRACRCGHDNIIKLLQVCMDHHENVYIVMEFAQHDLKTLLHDMKNSFLMSEIKTILIQILRGVDYLHSHCIIHRDLKTSNLLLTNRGIIKIADFGLARFFYSGDNNKMTPQVVTLWYRAPELLVSNSGNYSEKIDIWSIGCIFGEILLKGKPLFSGKSETHQLTEIFSLLGTPNEIEWPGFTKIALNSPIKIPKFSAKTSTRKIKLREEFKFLTNSGFNLLVELLYYNPLKRPNAINALNDEFFIQDPQPKPPDMFPSFPSRANLENTPNTPTAPIVNHGIISST